MANKNLLTQFEKEISKIIKPCERMEIIMSYMEKGVKIPIKYSEQIRKGQGYWERFLEPEDYRETARLFEKGGWNDYAKELYGIANELLNEQKAKRN